MKPIAALILATSIVGFSAGNALADCVDTTSSIEAQKPAGIAKDGTHAPLETQAETGTSSAEADTAQKDGDTMPLAGQEGGGDKNLATSQQDIEAQQQGDQTAAAKSDDCED